MLLGIWRHAARLAILPTIFPTNGLLPLPPCLKRPLSADAAYLLIWSCGSSGWPFSAMAHLRGRSAPQHLCRRVGHDACSRTVPCLRPVSDSANSRSSGCSNSAPMCGRERYPEDHWHGLQVFAIDGALFRTQDMPELRAHFGSGNTSTNRQTPYLMLRLVTRMSARMSLPTRPSARTAKGKSPGQRVHSLIAGQVSDPAG